MSKLKITSTDMLRKFIAWAQEKYTRKITKNVGGCDTCGYGGWKETVGFETDFDGMMGNLEEDIAEFTANLEAEIDEFSTTFKKNKS